jgi:hypothetical protein
MKYRAPAGRRRFRLAPPIGLVTHLAEAVSGARACRPGCVGYANNTCSTLGSATLTLPPSDGLLHDDASGFAPLRRDPSRPTGYRREPEKEATRAT